ncbi:MAG: polysaccharide pyruvyl transferase family protein [Ruminococcaceae bacterium]|nr:polysaccharide pyruvyl transferase family protein [Oscillospiraceae bacterium]
MKKVGVVTIHNAHNYGAVLQAYATQKTYEKLGVDCEIVDYSIPQVKKQNRFLLLPISKSNIKHDIRNALTPKLFLKRKKNFRSFLKLYLNLSKEKYNLKNIQNICERDYDILVTGSDQTFNLNLFENEKYSVPFFLPWKFKGKKGAYSSSMGEKIRLITEKQSDLIKTALCDFDYLSVRESATANYIEKLTNQKPDVLYDPTLILSQDEWNAICDDTSIPEKEYILFYTVLSEQWVVDFVKKVSEELGVEVIAVHPQNSFEISTGFKRFSHSGPSQFLSLIKNAKLVITTSFHGTVFSMIYKKPFYSIVLGEGNRINDLLTKAKLTHRIIKESNNVLINFEDDDVQALDVFFDNARDLNVSFIKKMIE